jgi:uncharacterized protein (TIGR03067 family)
MGERGLTKRFDIGSVRQRGYSSKPIVCILYLPKGRPQEDFAMRVISIVGLAAVVCTVVVVCRGDANKKELSELQGEWNFVAIEEHGVVSSPAEIKGQKWVIKGNEICAVVPIAGDHKMAFKLNSTKTPKEIDIMPQYEPYKGECTPAIYELESGRLRVCSAEPRRKDRPTDFTSGAMIFEKVRR